MRPPRDALPLLLTLGLTLLTYLLTRGTGENLGLNSLLGALLSALRLRDQPARRPSLLLLGLGYAPWDWH